MVYNLNFLKTQAELQSNMIEAQHVWIGTCRLKAQVWFSRKNIKQQISTERNSTILRKVYFTILNIWIIEYLLKKIFSHKYSKICNILLSVLILMLIEIISFHPTTKVFMIRGNKIIWFTVTMHFKSLISPQDITYSRMGCTT